jgi:hypothetical protein
MFLKADPAPCMARLGRCQPEDQPCEEDETENA